MIIANHVLNRNSFPGNSPGAFKCTTTVGHMTSLWTHHRTNQGCYTAPCTKSLTLRDHKQSHRDGPGSFFVSEAALKQTRTATLPWHLLLSCQVNDFLCGEEGESGKVARASGVGGLYDSPVAGWGVRRVGMGPACPYGGQSGQWRAVNTDSTWRLMALTTARSPLRVTSSAVQLLSHLAQVTGTSNVFKDIVGFFLPEWNQFFPL